MTRQQQDFDFLFKVVMIGDSGVGKTNLLSRFVDNTFNVDSKPTIGVEFATKTINLEGKTIKNQIWDTAGQERFRAITNAYYRGAIGAIIAFDLTKLKTFENVQKWLAELKQNAEQGLTIMLLGNKSDLQETREVKYELVEDFVKKNRLLYLQTSAANGNNVSDAFNQLIKEIFVQFKNKMPEDKDPKNNRRTSATNGSPTSPTKTNKTVEDNKAIKTDNIVLNPSKVKKEKKKGCC